MSTTAFGSGDDEKLALLALAMKFCSMDAAKNSRQDIFKTAEILSRRLCQEKIVLPDNIKFKIVDKLMQLAPHYMLRPLSDVAEHAAVSQTHLCVVLDTSGSMGSVINSVKLTLKEWILSVMGRYTGVSIILFDSQVHGPFNDVKEALDKNWGSGSTAAVPALEKLRSVLINLKSGSDTLFITDGQFDEGKEAYKIPVLPNISKFVMVFPSHTPSNAESEHYAYLPRITPPGIPIYSQRAASTEALSLIFNTCMSGPMYVPIEHTLYTPIAGEYVMLNNMTIFQMNKLVSDLLEYPELDIVHLFFSYLIGVYNAMMSRGGDLLNTLRSTEMRLMWSLLQPLKKRFAMVPADHIHAATAAMVLEFLETYESTVCDIRDKRLAELKRQSQTPDIVAEVAEIRKAFNDMKKVDDFDRILAEVDKYKSRGFRSIFIKFNYLPEMAIEKYRLFPNIGRADMLEMYKMIASIGVCNKSDPDAIEMINDADCNGLVLALRLISYKKTDEVKMTLTATQVMRIVLGFFTSQMIAGYTFTNDHIRIRNSIWRLCTKKYKHVIMSNLTNMQEQSNQSPEWIRILCGVAKNIKVVLPVSTPPADNTLWIKTGDGFVLNDSLLTLMTDRNTAVIAVRYVAQLGPELDVHVVNVFTIDIKDFSSFIVIREDRELTMDEWYNEVVRVLTFSDGSTMPVTNGMVLQEHLDQNAYNFVERYWECGHRLVVKSGAAHPAQTYGDTSIVREAVDSWMMTAWTEYKASMHFRSSAPYPVVSTKELQMEVSEWLAARARNNPITYSREALETIPIPAVVRKLPLSDNVMRIALRCAKDSKFSKLSGDEQTVFVSTVVPDANDTFEQSVRVELEQKIDIIVPGIASRFAPMEVVAGVGSGGATRIRTVEDWTSINVGEALDLTPTYDESDFTCPLSGELFEDPVSFGGHVYERYWLEQWLEFDPRRSSPLTRATTDSTGKPLQICSPPVTLVTELAKYKANRK